MVLIIDYPLLIYVDKIGAEFMAIIDAVSQQKHIFIYVTTSFMNIFRGE